MNETLPDRLSIDPKSPYYNEELITHGVGIRFNGTEKTNVEEYCVSEGWIRVVAGRARDRHGRPLMMKLRGKVEPFLEEQPAAESSAPESPAPENPASENPALENPADGSGIG